MRDLHARAGRRLGRVRAFLRRFGNRPRALVLSYHRVHRLDFDPLELSVAPELFEAHLRRARAFATPVRFDRLLEAIRTGGARRRWVCVTLDDGYADARFNAFPILERTETPATVFVATGQHALRREFWWDEITQLAGVESNEYHELHRLVDGAPPQQREQLIQEMFDRRGIARALRPVNRVLRREEIQSLAASELVEIGAHTVTHPPLDALDREAQRREIGDSKKALEDVLGREVTSFAYPHGRFSEVTREEVVRAGFRQACTTAASDVRSDSDPLLIPRITVGAWTEDTLARVLSYWFGGGPAMARPGRASPPA